MNTDNEETASWVVRAQAGDTKAFDYLVRHFQDRAVAYAVSILGNLQAAEDAAQEAFVEVYGTLPALRLPAAFAVWLRKIIFKHCNRMTRAAQLETVPLASVSDVASVEADMHSLIEQRESHDDVHRAIHMLPSGQRAVVALFYMGQHSYSEIAQFLELPISTVKSRLHEGRNRLKERMLPMIEDSLYESRPSKDEEFLRRVSGNIATLLSSCNSEQDIELMREDGSPLAPLMVSILIWAIDSGASDVFLVPKAASVSVEFKHGNLTRQMMTLPKQVQRALTDRIKMAADMNIDQHDNTQSGTIPIRCHDLDFDGTVSCRLTKHGESLSIHILQK